MDNLCIIYNYAQLYREPIFKSIDAQWNCDWYFGENDTDIKGMDVSKLKRVHILQYKRLSFSAWYRLKGLSKHLKKNKYSTYLMLGEPYCLSAWGVAIKHKLFGRKEKLYFWSHGWYGKESRAVTLIKKLFFNLADGIFLYGNYARDLMIEKGFKKDKLFVIHNSLDHTHQVKLRKVQTTSNIYINHFHNNNPTLIFIGRLTSVKRLDLLLEALLKLKKQGILYNLVLVGDGSERCSLESNCKELGISDQVWFYGACYDDNKNAELIFNADLCVSPGNVGLTAMHVMVFGTPVITHNDFKWQMPEFEAIHPGITGNFFRSGDVNDLANSISKWFDNHHDRESVRLSCYEEIDSQWTPEFQMAVLQKNLQ